MATVDPSGPTNLHPSYAPDGRKIAFTTDWRGESEIWAVATVDGTIRPLFSDQHASVWDPAWSPSGTWIVFASNRGGKRHIWLVRPDGSGLRQLTTGPANDDLPAWSRDSTKVAFVSDRTGVRNIWVVNANGSGEQQITRLESQDNDPSFSPDGTQIVFAGYDVNPDQANLWIIGANGTGLRRLTSGVVHDESPSWSQRGIVFSSDRLGAGGALWVIQPDATGLRVIPNVFGLDPRWAPDANKVAFASFTTGGIDEFNFADNTIRQIVHIMGFFVPLGTIRYSSTSNGNNIILVSILSSSNFDPVKSIDRSSISFGPTGDERSLIVNADGTYACGPDYGRGTAVPDLRCAFDPTVAKFTRVSQQAILRALDANRERYEGRSAVTVPTCPRWASCGAVP